MARAYRTFLYSVVAILLLLFAAITVSAVMSNWYMMQGRLAGDARYLEVISASGEITFYFEPNEGYPAPSFISVWPVPPKPSPDEFLWHTLGFQRSVGWNRNNTPFTAYTIPYWPLVLFGATWIAWRLVQFFQTRRRMMAGHCVNCGYDLRATPERCPECGTISHTGQ